ncbi:MAG: hypothetical protein PHZ17_03945 [Sulfurovum sp.]|nr:hypothetical protein [Sulfurovum sp.]
MKFILKIVLISILFFSSILLANIDECKSDLYYANGIMMNETEQNATRMWKFTVKDLLSAKPDLFGKIAGVKIAYNRSQWFMDDVTESFEQMMSNEWGWQAFSLYFGIYLTDKGFQEDWIPHIEDLNKQINSYKESIGLGHGMIVLAHSQGNFYTNEAYDGLDDWMKSYFHMMGVATPADHAAGDGPYVKFHNDIINLIPTSLPSNREDTRHHGFPSYDAHDFFLELSKRGNNPR